MTVAAHAFDTTSFDAVLAEYDQAIESRAGWLAAGKGDAQAICRQAVQYNIWNGCIVLVLGREDALALRYFRQALAYGLIGLGAPGSRKGPSKEPRMVSIADYSSAVQMAVCFGDRPAMEEVARYPEERYRNPNVVAGEDSYGYHRAWKYLLLGDAARALKEMQNALTLGPEAAARKDMEAFIHLLAKDEKSFRSVVEETLRLHRLRYAKEPADPEGIICFPILMLCRMAIDRGIAVEERPYLPIRLLPTP